VRNHIIFHSGATGVGNKANVVHIMVAFASESYRGGVEGADREGIVVRIKQNGVPVISEFSEREDLEMTSRE
jgi:hypothetical protein